MKVRARLGDNGKLAKLPISYEEKGYKIGFEEGVKKAEKIVIQNLLDKGYDVEFIADALEISIDEVNRLKEE